MNSQLVFVLKEAEVSIVREKARASSRSGEIMSQLRIQNKKFVCKKQEVVLSRPGKIMQILHNVCLEMPHRFFYLALIELVPKLWKQNEYICLVLIYRILLKF